MKKLQSKVALVMAAVVAVAIPLAPAAGQEEQPKIVYGRSAGELDLPEENEVFIMNADGTDPVQLTNNDKEDAFPALSPDGSRIAFSRRVNGQYDLFVMDAAGSNVKPLMRTRNADEVLPSWSPSGGRLA
jgi:Tol biopolymer transport system component